MKRVLLAAFLCICAAYPAGAQTMPIKVVVFGDSITSGYQIAKDKAYPNILEQQLLSQGYNTKVINMSVVGQTTTDGVNRINELLALNPDIVIVQLGLNDALRGIDPKRIVYKNLHEILFALRSNRIGTIILAAQAPEIRGKEYIRTLDHIYRVSAENHQATLYPDILKHLRDREDLTLADGMHPNEKGVLTLVHKTAPYVARLVKWRIDLQNFKNSSK